RRRRASPRTRSAPRSPSLPLPPQAPHPVPPSQREERTTLAQLLSDTRYETLTYSPAPLLILLLFDFARLPSSGRRLLPYPQVELRPVMRVTIGIGISAGGG